MEEQTKQEKYEAVLHNLHKSIEREKALRAELEQLRKARGKPVTEYTTGHCKERAKPGGCQLHNLHCGYPQCDRKPITHPAPEQVEQLKAEIERLKAELVAETFASNARASAHSAICASSEKEVERQSAERTASKFYSDCLQDQVVLLKEQMNRQAALLKQCKSVIIQLYGCYPPPYIKQPDAVAARDALAAIEAWEKL